MPTHPLTMLLSGTTWPRTRTRTCQSTSSRVSSQRGTPPCCPPTTSPHRMQPIDCPTQRSRRAITGRRACLLQGSARRWLATGRLETQHLCLGTVSAVHPLLLQTRSLAREGTSLQSRGVSWGGTHKGLMQVALLILAAPQHNQLEEDCHKFPPCPGAEVEGVSFPWTEGDANYTDGHSREGTAEIAGTATQRC